MLTLRGNARETRRELWHARLTNTRQNKQQNQYRHPYNTDSQKKTNKQSEVYIYTPCRAQSTEHRAQNTEHRTPMPPQQNTCKGVTFRPPYPIEAFTVPVGGIWPLSREIHDIDMNNIENRERTLQTAVLTSDPELLRTLLKGGLNRKQKDSSGLDVQTVLDGILQENIMDIVKVRTVIHFQIRNMSVEDFADIPEESEDEIWESERVPDRARTPPDLPDFVDDVVNSGDLDAQLECLRELYRYRIVYKGMDMMLGPPHLTR